MLTLDVSFRALISTGVYTALNMTLTGAICRSFLDSEQARLIEEKEEA